MSNATTVLYRLECDTCGQVLPGLDAAIRHEHQNPAHQVSMIRCADPWRSHDPSADPEHIGR